MNATSGTNAFTWSNALGFWISVLTAFVTPDMITNLLGNKYAMFAPAAIFLYNWLGHGMTGNSKTSILPGVLPANDPAKGSLG